MQICYDLFAIICVVAPKLVIYDNACSLHAYCLNRDPIFFMDTVFRVDGLHFKNHTGKMNQMRFHYVKVIILY